jgi:hypothetical protein
MGAGAISGKAPDVAVVVPRRTSPVPEAAIAVVAPELVTVPVTLAPPF